MLQFVEVMSREIHNEISLFWCTVREPFPKDANSDNFFRNRPVTVEQQNELFLQNSISVVHMFTYKFHLFNEFHESRALHNALIKDTPFFYFTVNSDRRHCDQNVNLVCSAQSRPIYHFMPLKVCQIGKDCFT